MKILWTCLTICAASAAHAGFYQDSYCTVVSDRDRENSNGVRLTSVAQIIQNERANYHLNRHRDAGDQGDATFGNRDYRFAIPKIMTANSAGPLLTRELVRGSGDTRICVLLEGADMPDLGMEMEIWRDTR